MKITVGGMKITVAKLVGAGIIIPSLLATLSMWDTNSTAAFWAGFCVILGIALTLNMELVDACLADIRENVEVMGTMCVDMAMMKIVILKLKKGEGDDNSKGN